ncbi:MAG: phytanoyl-CoA dioxygenase family protein [Pirellulales bacterium]
MADSQHYQQLIEDGYCVVENVLSSDFLARLRVVTDTMIDAVPTEEARIRRSTGSMISVSQDVELVDLIAHSTALDALKSMGLEDCRFQSGYVISKPPGGPRLFWHFDWGGWSHPISFKKRPAQIFLMYYLTDTSPHNGCLRVIPGSHLHENPLHSLLAQAHTEDLDQADDLSRIEFQTYADEIDLPVHAGDLVLGDSRLLHAAHANQSSHRRTVITLWFQPFYAELPEEIKSYSASRAFSIPPEWPTEARNRLEHLLVYAKNGIEPAPFSRDYYRPDGKPIC